MAERDSQRLTPRVAAKRTLVLKDLKPDLSEIEKEWSVDGAWRAAGRLVKEMKDAPRGRRAVLRARLVQPDGTPAAGVRVWLVDKKFELLGLPTLTGAAGQFQLRADVPGRDIAGLSVHGAQRSTFLALDADDLVFEVGGTLRLREAMAALPVPAEVLPEQGEVHLGEGDCARSFHSYQGSLERFRYGAHVRLVGPSLWPLVKTFRLGATRTKGLIGFLGAAVTSGFTARSAIGSPVDIDDYWTDLAENPQAVPRAATLGLGYIVRFVQQWTPTGLSLGDLLFSLPLAPGESQRIVTRDRASELAVRDENHERIVDTATSESNFDTSTVAAFTQALREATSSNRSYSTTSDSWEYGGGFGLFGLISVSGGRGGASTSGNADGSQTTSRDLVNAATEDFASRLHAAASYARQANRTDIRVAQAHDGVRGVIRTLTNQNRTRALTMQWWQVVRNFEVATEIDDVSLVVHVPLELVRWLPSGEPRQLTAIPATRSALLARYDAMLQHAEVIRRRIAHDTERRHGLDKLIELASNPRLAPEVNDPEEEAEEIAFRVEVAASVLPIDRIEATLVGWNGRRYGPYALEPTSPEPRIEGDANTEGAALALLRNAREQRAAENSVRVADFSLPRGTVRSGLARLELRHRYLDFRYDRTKGTASIFNLGAQRSVPPQQVLPATRLTDQLDGPSVTRIDIVTSEGASPIQPVFAVSGPIEGAQSWPLSTQPEPPLLRRADVMRIEALLQHILGHALMFSRLVWQSMTAEERIILLEPYTLGVAPGGVWTGGQDVPLLDCIENRVLGFAGNSVLFPFHLPPSLVADSGTTTRDLQDAIVAFHSDSFHRAIQNIALPTRGCLGEAVLGDCSAAERIDLTRFWNWPDSPIPAAPALGTELGGFSPIDLLGQQGASGPSNLKPPDQHAAIEAPPTDPALLKALLDKVPGLTIDRSKLLPSDALAAAALGAAGSAQGALGSAMTSALNLLKQDDGKALSLMDLLDKHQELIDKRDGLSREETAATKADAANKRSALLGQLRTNPESFLNLIGAKPPAEQEAFAQGLASEILGGTPLNVGEMASIGSALEGLGTLAPILGAALGIPIPPL
jgi:hypothetical protein